MKLQRSLIFLIALVLMAGTAGALTWLKGHQRLGKPGINATPVSGSVVMNIDLPERVLDFTSTNVPESEIVLGYLPKDTSFAQRFYQAPDGFWANANVILMGADRTSIHRPEYCLLGSGWRIEEKIKTNIAIGGAPTYQLPVMKWVIQRSLDGQRGLYVFWFVADNELATHNVPLQYYLVRDLMFTGILQRWAYISYFSVCAPGQEEATFERMGKLIAASVPQFQPAPRLSGATVAARQ